MKRSIAIALLPAMLAVGCATSPWRSASSVVAKPEPPKQATQYAQAPAATRDPSERRVEIPGLYRKVPVDDRQTGVGRSELAATKSSKQPTSAQSQVERATRLPPPDSEPNGRSSVANVGYMQDANREALPLPDGSAMPADARPLFDAASEGGVSLEQLTAITEDNNPKIQGALAEIDSNKGGRIQAGLLPNPRMETNNPEIWSGQDSQVNFGFQQDWITKGKLRLDKAAADQKVRVAEANYVIERVGVLTAVRMHYFQAVAAREKLENAEKIKEISYKANQVAQELLDSGEGTITDVLLLTAEYERARVAYDNAKTLYNSKLQQLAAATGVPDLQIQGVNGQLSDRPPFYDQAYIKDFLQTRSSHMIMARAEVLHRQIMLHRQEVEPYPDFRFGPHYAASTTRGSRREFWFTFVFDIPVWNLNQGNIRSARADLVKAGADLETKRMELISDLADVHSRHEMSQVMLSRIENSILPTAEKAQTLIQEGYAKGQFDVNRVLESQRSLLEARRDQIEAFEQAWVTAAELAGYLQFEQFP
jgi:cobalt-zinc-cadmium efflux system outer membrane protein